MWGKGHVSAGCPRIKLGYEWKSGVAGPLLRGYPLGLGHADEGPWCFGVAAEVVVTDEIAVVAVSPFLRSGEGLSQPGASEDAIGFHGIGQEVADVVGEQGGVAFPFASSPFVAVAGRQKIVVVLGVYLEGDDELVDIVAADDAAGLLFSAYH